MGIWSWITGKNAIDKTLDIADKTTDGIISGFDKIFFTDEEKSDVIIKKLELAEQASKLHIELMKATADENSIRSVTRRMAAIVIMSITVLSIIFIGVIWKFDQEWSLFLLELVKYFQVGWAFVGVCAFFFGTHYKRAETGVKK